MVQTSEAVHLDHVDGLRAIAVLSVILYHSVVHATGDPRAVAAFAFGGHGVELFFVISGLCLSFPFLRSYHRSGDLRFSGPEFFAKRIARIMPPYYAVVVLFGALALTVPWQQVALHSHAMSANLTLESFLAHFLFAAKADQLLDASFWTLRIEAIWYVLFPLCLLAYVYARSWYWAVLAACPAIVLLGAHVPGFGTAVVELLALPAFMLGIVAADWHLRRLTPPRWLLAAGIVVAVAAVALETSNPTADNGRIRFLWDVAAFAFVVLAGSSQLLRSALSVRYAVAVGVASYSIYLVHEPVVAAVEFYGVPAPLAYALGVGAGFLLWWAVERPFMSGAIRRPLVAALQRVLAGSFARQRRVTSAEPGAAALPVPETIK